jgi:flagellar basal body-associated protein FliL
MFRCVNDRYGVFYRNQLSEGRCMWIILFIVAVLFVLGSALILLRSAKTPKIPDTVKAQPYEDDE